MEPSPAQMKSGSSALLKTMTDDDLRQRAFAFAVYDNAGLFADNYLNDVAHIKESKFNVSTCGIWT